MRVLFYTAAAVAATIATLGQAVKLDTMAMADLDSSHAFDSHHIYSQIDAFSEQVQNTVQNPVNNNNINNNNANLQSPNQAGNLNK